MDYKSFAQSGETNGISILKFVILKRPSIWVFWPGMDHRAMNNGWLVGLLIIRYFYIYDFSFQEFLFFVLPLINFTKIKNFVSRKLRPSSSLSIDHQRSAATYQECVICGEWPYSPYEMGCVHVFCYVCLRVSLLSPTKWAVWSSDMWRMVVLPVWDGLCPCVLLCVSQGKFTVSH